MAYVNEGIDQRAEVLSNKQDTLVVFVKHDGKLAILNASENYIRIVSPTGGELVPRTHVPGAGAATGKLTHSRTWEENTFPLDEDYIAEWEYQLAGDPTVRYETQFFDVVRMKLPCMIDANNLANFYPDIVSHLTAIGETEPDKFCRTAWSLMLDNLRSKRARPSLILDKARLVNPATQKALELACRALSREVSDVWADRAKVASDLFNGLMSGLGELRYDKDQNGLAAPNEKRRINIRRWTV